jgi:hypothetical protein
MLDNIVLTMLLTKLIPSGWREERLNVGDFVLGGDVTWERPFLPYPATVLENYSLICIGLDEHNGATSTEFGRMLKLISRS